MLQVTNCLIKLSPSFVLEYESKKIQQDTKEEEKEMIENRAWVKLGGGGNDRLNSLILCILNKYIDIPRRSKSKLTERIAKRKKNLNF